MRYAGQTWRLEADREQVFPDDPGMGTPLLIYAPSGQTSTLYCTLGEGVICGDYDEEVPSPVYDWLVKLQYEAEAWVYSKEIQS
jgi:hypothetical protein